MRKKAQLETMRVIQVVFTFIFVVFINIRHVTSSLKCYQCGIVSDKSDSCDAPPKTPTYYIVQCQPQGICSKTISFTWEGDEEEVTTRGCATPTTFNGRRHELGCNVDQRTGATVCYCDENLCNGAPTVTTNPQQIVIIIIITAALCLLIVLGTPSPA